MHIIRTRNKDLGRVRPVVSGQAGRGFGRRAAGVAADCEVRRERRVAAGAGQADVGRRRAVIGCAMVVVVTVFMAVVVVVLGLALVACAPGWVSGRCPRLRSWSPSASSTTSG